MNLHREDPEAGAKETGTRKAGTGKARTRAAGEDGGRRPRFGGPAVLLAAFGLSFALNVLHLALPIYSLQVFNRVLPSGSLPTLALMTTLLLGLTLCTVLVEGVRSAILARTALKPDLESYGRAAAVVLHGDPAGAEQLRAADKVRAFRTSSLLTSLFDAPWSVAFVLAMYCLHPWLGHLTVAAIVTLAAAGGLGPLLTRVDRDDAAGKAGDILQQFDAALAQRDAVEAMGLRGSGLARILALHRRLAMACVRASERQSWSDAATRGLRTAFQVLILALAALLVVEDDIGPGTIVASSMLFARAVAPFERLGPSLHVILDALRAWRRTCAARGAEAGPTACRLALPPITGAISAERLCYRVPRREKPVVGPLSFEVKAGTALAIVGPQGAGKSTLARLLAGALQPSSGKVRLDGAELAQFDRRDLGAQVGFLPEDVQLGTGSVAAIIARSDAPDPDEVVKAALLAGAHASILALPDGYQTVVQAHGSFLSAGERQQIGLARAFYRKPALIILDEPAGHLDDVSEAVIVHAIRTLKEHGSTVLFVSRFAGLLHITDKVILLEKGSLAVMADPSKLTGLLAPKLATSSNGAHPGARPDPAERRHAL